jgi:hypothetical protein
MMRADKVDLSHSLRETLSMASGRQSARSRGKASTEAAAATQATRPLTARCGCYHEESVRSERVVSVEAPNALNSNNN